ncbi:MAG: protein phosphatase CheZ [Methylococcaceae bacterium]|nr:protein phosphatase CheZ [Methylococcaceae bacterium]MCI0660970.1 protein phosphatase CheZ [Acidobacteriota bacterium]
MMQARNEDSLAARLDCAKQFVAALEEGDERAADEILDNITSVRETRLFREVGKLTRQLHEAITGFTLDERIACLTEKEIPDAKERLNYVITMTQQSADTTLGAVEELLPLSEGMGARTAELREKWSRFLRKEMDYDEFKRVSNELVEHFSSSSESLETMQSKLNEVLMAQGFQDLTGQIIKRVINLVQDVEFSMVEMIRISGGRLSGTKDRATANPGKLEGPAIPGILDEHTIINQDGVDDLLSSLGF